MDVYRIAIHLARADRTECQWNSAAEGIFRVAPESADSLIEQVAGRGAAGLDSAAKVGVHACSPVTLVWLRREVWSLPVLD
jgi:hypothetical protein